MRSLFTLSLLLCVLSLGCDDDSSGGNNENNTNNTNNANNTNNSNNINNTNNLNNTNNTNNVSCQPECAPWEECLSDGAGGGVCSALTCTPACDDLSVCLSDGNGGTECAAQQWVHHPITISDPVVNGTSLMVPIDVITFANNSEEGILATAFGRDYDDPSLTHLWVVNEGTGTHEKLPLSGDVFPEGENFCMDEDWCQFISYDPDFGTYVVTGPLASGIMEVTTSGVASMAATDGVRPSSSYISYTHRFDWENRRLYLYGYVGPSSFSSTVHVLDLDSGVWSEAATGLPQVGENCIAIDTANNVLYSFGGDLTTDGGNSSSETDNMVTVDLTSGQHSVSSLPTEIGPRAHVACAYLPDHQSMLLFGGAVVNDRYNEILNEYNNDLWLYHIPSGTWRLVALDTEIGTFEEPDSYGDQAFVGAPEGPNFGKNRGYMQYDPDGRRLIIMGAVPIFTHEQYYTLDLTLLPHFLP